MIRKILLAFDGSQHSWTAWQHAVEVARAFGAGIKAISVVDARVAHHPKLLDADTLRALNVSEDSKDALIFAFEARRRRLLEEVQTKTAQERLSFQSEVAHGIPAEVVCLEETDADLIAMGHRGETPPWPALMLGSNAEAVIRQCTKPILLAPADYTPVERIVVCYDGSENATHALFFSAYLAEKMQLPLMVLSVNRNLPLAEQTISEVGVHLKLATMPIERRAVSGLPAESILKTAASEGCGLIVMGVRGHSVFRESLIGRTTEEVMRRTPVALLLVK